MFQLNKESKTRKKNGLFSVRIRLTQTGDRPAASKPIGQRFSLSKGHLDLGSVGADKMTTTGQ